MPGLGINASYDPYQGITMRFSFWLIFITLFSVSASTSKNSENILEVDLSREVLCSSVSEDAQPPAQPGVSVTIFPKKAELNGWFKSAVTIVKESALLHEFTMNCKVVEFNYFCYWDMYYHLTLDLENIWVEKISNSKKVSHFTGVWRQGSFAQPEIIYCSQIK